jgi:hypothetical protein
MMATPYVLKRCHPHPDRRRGPTSPLHGEVMVVVARESIGPLAQSHSHSNF